MAAAARPLPPPTATRRDTRAGRGKTAATGVYLLYLLAPFTVGLTGLAGGIWAHLSLGEADDWVRSHLRRQIGLFWLGLAVGVPLLLLNLVGEVLKWVLIGFPVLWLSWLLGVAFGAWFLWKTVGGLLRLTGGRGTQG